MTAAVIVAVVLLGSTTALLVWGPRLTSLGIATEPKKQEESRSRSEHDAR